MKEGVKKSKTGRGQRLFGHRQETANEKQDGAFRRCRREPAV